MPAKRAASAKKGAKKSSKKKAKKTASIPVNLQCIEACIERYRRCLAKGVDQATCIKRLQKNIANCAGGIFPTDE
ncbi:MAG TPA: hypothetical protein VE961_25710 [Pyrinomonadaceae bacterium]|nr:hypothetical protein [Pyrinomonadaceae bacterium]